ncbi:hypothetical protein GCM10020295_49840 [Streptomyces cinereospinus]
MPGRSAARACRTPPYGGGSTQSTGQSTEQSAEQGTEQSAGAGTRATEEQPASRSQDRPAAGETVTTPAGDKVEKGDGEYEVVEGDTLSTIAADRDVQGGWEKLFELNKDIVEDADLIYPGQQLHLQ